MVDWCSQKALVADEQFSKLHIYEYHLVALSKCYFSDPFTPNTFCVILELKYLKKKGITSAVSCQAYR